MPGIYVVSHGDLSHDVVAFVGTDLGGAGRAAISLAREMRGDEIPVYLGTGQT